MKVAAIIQARMGSSRFPGKMLAKLAGRPLIDWVVMRVLQAQTLSQVVLATTTQAEDNRLVEYAKEKGLNVFRGSESDVLGRIWKAAQPLKVDAVVRVCADNPFIDGREIDRLVKFFEKNDPDYAFNHLDRMDNGYADGFGAEMISISLLGKLADCVTSVEEREHLTHAVWNRADELDIRTISAPIELRHPDREFDVDTPEDLKELEQVAKLVGIDGSAEAFIRNSEYGFKADAHE